MSREVVEDQTVTMSSEGGSGIPPRTAVGSEMEEPGEPQDIEARMFWMMQGRTVEELSGLEGILERSGLGLPSIPQAVDKKGKQRFIQRARARGLVQESGPPLTLRQYIGALLPTSR